MSHSPDGDIVDRLLGIAPHSPLDKIRAKRPQARENIEKSYRALFQPVDVGSFPLRERHAVAAFVAALHREPAASAFYASEISASEPDLAEIISREAGRGNATGPYGRYPSGPLSSEDKPGPAFSVESQNRKLIGERLAAGLDHAHLLVFHPRDAHEAAFETLHKAGWSTSDIVTLSQLISFLTFQIRIVAGLRELAASL